jgi:hypothetical protein
MHQAGLAAAAALPADGTEGATPAEATPEGTPEQAATAPADSFTRLDPNALPAELRPYYESMQADYTRKTQEIAPTRQLQSELGLDGDGLRQAAELYNALQDPQQLVEFYNELSTALQAQGLTPAQAEQAATQHIQDTLTPGGEDPALMDPEERRLADLEAKLARFEQSQQAEAQQRQNEQRQMYLIAETNRQEAVVREQYPDWTQEDIDATYEMSSFYGGSLIDAAARLADYTSSKVARILNGKGAVASNPANATLPPALAGVTKPLGFGDDLEAAHKAALEAARALP